MKQGCLQDAAVLPLLGEILFFARHTDFGEAMKRFLLFALVFVVLLFSVWMSRPVREELSTTQSVFSNTFDDGLQPLLPLPAPSEQPFLRVSLGARLFSDTRLSADYSIACASCHRFDLGGSDGRRVSIGIQGGRGVINAPSVFNSGLSFVQFWDGRAASLQAQVAGPIHNPLEMGSSWRVVLERLAADEAIRRDFMAAYPDGLTAENVADAIASFERSLLTVDARFDRYLRGDSHALNALEIEGYRRFREFGCISCHQGVLLGGNMFQKFGVLGDYFAARSITQADLGRYNVTGRDEDRHVFKVPSLRNVALTAPYFHDGSANSLEKAVAEMGRYQLGRELSADDVKAIVAFLDTLTGQQPVQDVVQ